jgi:hypothetical protein
MKHPVEAQVIDMTLPRSKRPMVGLDIEEWRTSLDLSKFKSQYALGFRNINHYNRIAEGGLLSIDLELLIRLYEESPKAIGWEKYTIKQLFELMYGEDLKQFEGTRFETYALVDLGTRFTRIFGRSPSRKYQWLREDSTTNSNDLKTYAVMECILAKLYQLPNPKEVLERVAKKVWKLRGHDLDIENPIPTLTNPPTRQKTGRKSKHEEINKERALKGLPPLPARRSAKDKEFDAEQVVAAAFSSAVKTAKKRAPKKATANPSKTASPRVKAPAKAATLDKPAAKLKRASGKTR